MLEAAGLALGVFPLLIKGLGVYFDGIEKIKGMWYWQRNLRTILRELDTENSLFQDACLYLLDECGYDGTIADLMEGDPEPWIKSGVQGKLQDYMGQRIANSFIAEVGQLYSYVEKLAQKLRIDIHVCLLQYLNILCNGNRICMRTTF